MITKGRITSAINLLNQQILKIATKPIKTMKHKPWFDKECKVQKNKLNEVFHEFLSDSTHREEYLQANRSFRKLITNKKTDYNERKLMENLENSKHKPWIMFKKNQLLIPPISKMEWEAHFNKLLCTNENDQNTRTNYSERLSSEVVISESEVYYTINSTPKNKAAGKDGIYYELLRQTGNIFIPIWTKIINYFINKPSLPTIWRHGKALTIHKKGNIKQPDNYRGITLLPCLYKVFTTIIKNRIYDIVDPSLPPEQFGFRKGKNTLQAIDIIIQEITNSLKHKKKPKYIAFVDFKKAFNLVPRAILLRKIETCLGSNHGLLNIIEEILKENTIEIWNGIETVAKIKQSKGVLQGDRHP